jgi:hypothetical protein
MKGAVLELPYLAAYVHIVLVSHDDMTNVDIVLGCDPHHLFPSPRELCLFLFSLAFSAFCIVACSGGVEMGSGPGLTGSDGSSQ